MIAFMTIITFDCELLDGKNIRSNWMCKIFTVFQNFPRFSPSKIVERKARENLKPSKNRAQSRRSNTFTLYMIFENLFDQRLANSRVTLTLQKNKTEKVQSKTARQVCDREIPMI